MQAACSEGAELPGELWGQAGEALGWAGRVAAGQDVTPRVTGRSW